MLSAKYFFHLVYHSHVTVPGQAFLLFIIIFPGHGTLRALDCTSFLMWTSSDSWVGSYDPIPEAGYKLIGTTIPTLNMAVYSPKNVNYFTVKKNPRNLLRALAERITHQIHSFLQVFTGWNAIFPYLFIHLFFYLWICFFFRVLESQKLSKIKQSMENAHILPPLPTSSLPHH